MCGIVGFCSCREKVNKAVLTSMRDALTHRGPDDVGIYIDEENNVGLGHTRLSILDLSSLGHQPMSNENGSIWITYNGEVYNYKDGLFLFGSELKSLMKHPEFSKDVNYSVLSLYLRYGYIPAPFTIFDNTYKLRPGYYLSVSNNDLREIKYWDIVDFYLEEPINASEDDIAEELEDLLIDSFKYRLFSDVPVGVFLSGGIDFTTVTAFF